MGRVWVKPKPTTHSGFLPHAGCGSSSCRCCRSRPPPPRPPPPPPRGGAATTPVPAPLRRCSGAAPACQPTGRREMGRRAGASSLPLPAQRRPINGAAVAGQPVSGRRSDRRGREVKASPIITERGEGVRSPLRYQNPNQIQRE